MRAVRFSEFGGPEVLELVEVPVPEPASGQVRIAVRAVGVNPADWKARRGLFGAELPRGAGLEAAGVVDALGDGVGDVAVGDRVFGPATAGAADEAVLSDWARAPASLSFTDAAALPVAVETATRSLDLLGVGEGHTLLVNGASGAVGLAAIQLAHARGARVIGTGGARGQERIRRFGAEPVPYGAELERRVRAIAPDGVDRALDAGPGGAIPTLVALAGGPDHVVAIADFQGAQDNGVRFTGGPGTERAWHALGDVATQIEAGRFELPVARVLPLAEIAEAQRLSESGEAGGKIVLEVD